ncbi:MAG: phosphodiesterase [Steroidobacteraceae bacterium]
MIVAQISDTHISTGEMRYRNELALQRAVSHLMTLPARPDVVLITGDCVDAGSLEEYRQFQQLLQPLTMPVYVIPGNHDDRKNLQRVFGEQGAPAMPGFVQYVVDKWPVRLIALDTNVPFEADGFLCSERLAWLHERLVEQPERPTLIFMHHPPFKTGLKVQDDMGLGNAEAFWDIIADHPQVERIVAGHLHSAMLQRCRNTIAMTCPSTIELLLPDFHQPQRLGIVTQAPACLLHVWTEDSGLVTHTSIIGEYEPAKLVHDGERWLS